MPRIVVAYQEESKVGAYLAPLAACGVAASDLCLASPARTEGIDLAVVVDGADGLLLTGGDDLQPCLYRQARRPEAHLDPPSAERDQMEWDLLAAAAARRLPVFGICRGLQMLNVFRGGTLHQDIELETGLGGHACFASAGFALDHLAHEVEATDADHPFAARLRRHGRFPVNSRHHQAIAELGDGLTAIARSPDGLVEALAATSPDWWVRAVEWHPENLTAHHPVHLELHADFVEAARSFAASRSPEAVR